MSSDIPQVFSDAQADKVCRIVRVYVTFAGTYYYLFKEGRKLFEHPHLASIDYRYYLDDLTNPSGSVLLVNLFLRRKYQEFAPTTQARISRICK